MIPPVVDEYSRECLTMEVECSITSEEVVSTLASLFRRSGAPAFIRSVRAGPSSSPEPSGGGWRPPGLEPLHRARICLRERLLKETFISHFSDEMLKREIFADQLVAKVLVEDYCDHYNHNRPHSALGYLTPAEFGASADLDMKVEDVRKPEELESVLTLS